MTAEFKYTITVEKAEQTEDGLFIEGAASGLGTDSQGHEMDPAAITRFAEQIRMRAEAGDPVPYLDWHNQKSVMADLGHVASASVDPDWTLRVRVKLDEENPASTLLYSRIKRGKKFGMSVKGTAQKWARRIDDTGRSVMRFFDVALTEVSNTTQPIWTPSFGTVLAKAVIDEADAESVIDGGDSPEMPDTGTEELQPDVAETDTPADEDTNPEVDETEEAPEAEDTTADAESEDEEDEDEVAVEKAGAKYSKTARAKFLAMYQTMGDMLRAEGILDDEDGEPVEVKKADGDDAEATDDKADNNESDSAETETDTPADGEAASDSDDADKGADAEPVATEREQELERQLAEMTARAEAAEAKAKTPQMVVTPEGSKPADDAARVREEIAKLPREERLVAAFQLAEAARKGRR